MVVHTRATTRPGSLSSLRKTGIPTTWPTEKMHPTEHATEFNAPRGKALRKYSRRLSSICRRKRAGEEYPSKRK